MELSVHKRIKIIVILFIGFFSAYWLYVAFVSYMWEYEKYLRIVDAELNSIECVDHVDIVANRDLVLEEMTAYIYLKNKGEIVIFNANPGYRFDNIFKIGSYSVRWLDSNNPCAKKKTHVLKKIYLMTMDYLL